MEFQLRGIGAALVTPFEKNEKVDYAALEKLVEHVIRGGVDFVVALGTTAETPTLTAEEKQELLYAILKHCDCRIPVVCGVGGNNTEEVVQVLKNFDLRGVAAIMSVAPYYNKPTQDGLYLHFKTIADATAKPVLLYNVPGRTGSNLLPETVIRLANDCPNIFGIKEASGNMVQCMELIARKPENFVVLSGDDNLVLAQMAIGMEGVISVAANCYTKEMTDIVNLAIVNKFDKARKVHYKLLPGIDLLFAEGNPGGVKAALKYLGFCENVLRAPLVPVSDATAKKIQAFIKTL